MNVDHEVGLLIEEMKRLGQENHQPKSVRYLAFLKILAGVLESFRRYLATLYPARTKNAETKYGVKQEAWSTKDADGYITVKFGVLFSDEKCANLFEALVGTLKAAKKRKIIDFPGQILLQGAHDNVDVVLLQK